MKTYDVFKNNGIEVDIENVNLHIPSTEIKLISNQCYIFRNKGFPLIDVNNMYSTDKKCDIIVHICLFVK